MNFTPPLPKDNDGKIFSELLVLAERVCIESAKLSSMHNEHVFNAIKELLRKVNSYYSNKIESEGTHPIDIERAMKKDFEKDEHKRNLQNLSLIYIDVQRYIERLSQNEHSNFYSKKQILDIHNQFYSKNEMLPFLQIKREKEGEEYIKMKAGVLREDNVAIGRHTAPPFEKLDSLLNEYESFYKVYPYMTQSTKLIYAMAAHHRLTWIHPFLDGNGRTSRLVLDGSLYHMKLEGYGLWNISRGLARDTKGYHQYLSQADMVRQGELDGRGALSTKGFRVYVKFMLETALDQIAFMNESLKLDTLTSRIDNFVAFSQKNMYGKSNVLPKYSELLLRALLVNGELPRGKVKDIIGRESKTASTLIRKLIDLEYIESDTSKSPIRIKFNSFFASKIFPELIPN